MASVGLQLLFGFLVVGVVYYIGVRILGAIHMVDVIGSDLSNNIQQRTFEMISEKIGNKTVERLDDIDELLVHNYNLFNTFALYESEDGHGMTHVLQHFQKLDFYLANKKLDEAAQARNSLNRCFNNIFQKNNFPALQWAALIHSVDGQKVHDLGVENLKRIIDELSKEGLTQAKVKADVEAAKKKSGHN